ncbi:MAG: aldo/keto reductase [Armatimonadetes bacterium]|nr:aldo/keto reductase [Armatimonadota bacterium]MDW8122929.1 aldo/keto reductase [Armatimonadota bacterium]
MEFREFGRTGWKVSVIGMGCWGIGGQWGPVDEKTALATIWKSFECGVNFFDTADAYGEPPGLTEELLGKALRGLRSEVFITTKVGNWARRLGHPLPFSHPLHVVGCCHASLYRLKSDYIDLYLLHLHDPSEQEIEIFLEAFGQLHRQGLIRAYGISTNNFEALKKFTQWGGCQGCQIDYSILNRAPERDLLPFCAENGIGVMVRGPLAMGILTGKFTAETVFSDSVRRGWNDGPGRERFIRRLKVVDRLKPLASPERPLSHIALQFVLSHRAVSCAIPGAKSPAQAEQNALAGKGTLSEKELTKINQIVGPEESL